jgi:signal peptidase
MATIEDTPDGYRGRSVSSNLLRWLSALLAVAVTVLVAAGLLATIAYGLAPAFGYKVWMIDGGSMEPTIPKGSLVVSRHADPDELRDGDIITFKPPEATVSVTHRIIGITDTEGHLAFTTQGDANANPDPLDVDLAAGANRLQWSVPHIGRAVGFIRGSSGMLLFLAAPALLLAALWLRDEDESEEAGTVAG